MKRVYLVMDWRAAYDPDNAETFETCATEAEARLVAPAYGDGTVIVMVEEADLTAPPSPPKRERRKRT